MKKQPQLITDLFNTLLVCGYAGTVINAVSQDQYLIEIDLLLPYHKEIADFELLLPNLIQEFNCTDAKITKKLGKKYHRTIRQTLFRRYNIQSIIPTPCHTKNRITNLIRLLHNRFCRRCIVSHVKRRSP
jgi:hypothetical protein